MRAHLPEISGRAAPLARRPIAKNSALQTFADDSPAAQRLGTFQQMADTRGLIQRMEDEDLRQDKPIQRVEGAARPNNTGMPDSLKSGVETLSGVSMDHVKVHYNSDKPAAVQAHAYAQGSQIHLGPGQERHLPHEAWHVVQQAQGRVKPTMQLKGIGVNDDPGLEREADIMGAKAARMSVNTPGQAMQQASFGTPAIQRRLGVEAELSVPVTPIPAGPAAATADGRVRTFLCGSVFYDSVLSAPVNNYIKKADHGPISTAIDNARQQMDVGVQAHGHPAMPPLHAGAKPGIMEFVTDPFPVNTNAEVTHARTQIGLMAANIGAVHAAAAGGVNPTGVGGYQVGVPPVADFQNFATANGLAAATGTAIHTNIVGLINDQLYVQMTMGVHLRSMTNFMDKLGPQRTFFWQDRTPSRLASQADIGDPNHVALVRLVTKLATTDGKALVSNLGVLPAAVRNSASLKGYTSLLMSYIYGSYVYRQVDIAKNMVAALSKTPLHVVQQELDVADRPDQWAAADRLAYKNAIVAAAINRLQQATYQAYWPAGNHNAGLLGDWRAGWLPNVLSGASDSFAGDAANPGQLIMGPALADDHTIAPEDDARSQAIAPGPGRPAARDAPNPTNSGVIPMELRFIEERPQPGALLTLVNRGIDLIRHRDVR